MTACRPSRALSERFLIAVPTLREALRRLEATGAVELRHGSGVYVRADVARLIMVNPNRLRLDHGAMFDLLEARELIEPHLAAAAARNATDAQLAELAEAFSRTTAALSEDQALHVANMGFHRTIARLAGNGALAQVLDSLIDLHDQEQRHILDLYGDRDHDHACTARYCAAVRGRRPERARRLMVEHLRDVRVVVTRALNQGGHVGYHPNLDPELAAGLDRLDAPFDELSALPVRRAAGGTRAVARAPARRVERRAGRDRGPDDLERVGAVRIFRPSGGGPLPGLLWIHGGGMVVGSARRRHVADRVRGRGRRAWSCPSTTGWRPSTRIPAQVDDCYAALTWLAGDAAAARRRSRPDRGRRR